MILFVVSMILFIDTDILVILVILVMLSYSVLTMIVVYVYVIHFMDSMIFIGSEKSKSTENMILFIVRSDTIQRRCDLVTGDMIHFMDSMILIGSKYHTQRKT